MNPIHLKQLELSLSDIEDLSEEQQRKKIRIQWVKLTLIWHPDKNKSPKAAERFLEINEAYKILTGKNNNYRPEITQYYAQEEINIPSTAFDLLLQENIERAYEDLLKIFITLPTGAEKRAFVTQYASFLNLAESLEKNKEKLNSERVKFLYAEENETVLDGLIREWRLLIIHLFAEEYLSDFQYRQALASGDLWPILATRKLLSPIKYPVAVLNSISMVLSKTAYHSTKLIMQKIIADFMQQFYAYQEKKLTIQGVTITGLEIVGIIGLIAIPFYFATNSFLLLMSLPLITNLLEIIACPVNKLIRPLAAYTGIATITLCALLLAASLITAYALVTSLVFTSLMTFLDYLTLALSFYSLYEFSRMVVNLYNINPALGIFQAVVMGGGALLLLIPLPDIDPKAAISIISSFLLTLTNCVMLHKVNEFLENISAAMAKKYEVLPLPKEPVPEAIQRATLLGNKTASQSHRFFNTPKDAEYLEPKDQTFWQKTHSLFGGGMKPESQLELKQPQGLALEAPVYKVGQNPS